MALFLAAGPLLLLLVGTGHFGGDASRADPASAVDEDDGAELMGPPDRVDACEEKLRDGGVVFKPGRIPLHRPSGSNFTCGAEQIVRYVRGPGRSRCSSRPKMTCGLALAMGRFETLVNEESVRHFGQPVARVEHQGTYNCREMAAYPGGVSEHSYANAIDIKSFVIRGGREVSISRHYGRGPKPPDSAEGRFLRALAARLYGEAVFQVVLTPNFDGAHRSHFHLDLARYRVDGT